MMRWVWRTALAGTLILGSVAGCGRVLQGAITAAPALLPISDAQEIAIGQQAAQEILQEVSLVASEQVRQYVEQLGRAVAAESDRADIPYHFFVIQAEEPNAFALPGGFIFVTSGLLRVMENEAQLVGVLAHEVAHVAARHSIELIRQEAVARGVQVAALGTDAGTTQAIANVVRTLVIRGYGRTKELEADGLGAIYTARENYAPSALSNFLQRLSDVTGGQPAWFLPLATHPTLEQRLERIRQTIEENGLGGDELNQARFQQIMQTL